jgi:Cd2+/Zn2+-exporting ATPase
MDCPTEEAIIRRGLSGVPGVGDLHFDLFNHRLLVTHNLEDDADIVRALKRVGMDPQSSATTNCGTDACDEGPVWPEVERTSVRKIGSTPVASRRELVLLGVSGVLALSAEIFAWTIANEDDPIVLLISAASVLFGGIPTLRKGLLAIRAFTLNISFLMTVAVAGAFAIGEYPEAAVVVFLFSLAELIEK